MGYSVHQVGRHPAPVKWAVLADGIVVRTFAGAHARDAAEQWVRDVGPHASDRQPENALTPNSREAAGDRARNRRTGGSPIDF